MIAFAALLLILVGAMHSIVGDSKLISPLLAREDFPILMGSQRNARLTLWFGWHALTLFWWAQATVLLTIAFDEALTRSTILISLAIACGILGFAAIIVTKGRHLSWLLFLPISAILIMSIG